MRNILVLDSDEEIQNTENEEDSKNQDGAPSSSSSPTAKNNNNNNPNRNKKNTATRRMRKAASKYDKMKKVLENTMKQLLAVKKVLENKKSHLQAGMNEALVACMKCKQSLDHAIDIIKQENLPTHRKWSAGDGIELAPTPQPDNMFVLPIFVQDARNNNNNNNDNDDDGDNNDYEEVSWMDELLVSQDGENNNTNNNNKKNSKSNNNNNNSLFENDANFKQVAEILGTFKPESVASLNRSRLYESILKVILEIAKKPYAYFMSLLDWAGVAYGKNQHRFHSFLGNLLKSKFKAIEAEYKYQNENSDAIAKLFEILNHSSDWSRQDKMEQIRMNIPTSVMMQQDGATRKFIDTLIVLWGCEHVAFSIRGDLNIVIHSHITQNGWSELFDFIAPSVMERRNHEPREQMALHQNNFDITTMSHYYEFSGEKNTKNILSNKNTPIKQPNGGNAHYEKRDGTAQKKSDLFTTGTPVRFMKETKNDNSSSPRI
jgi:hypothetical protein